MSFAVGDFVEFEILPDGGARYTEAGVDKDPTEQTIWTSGIVVIATSSWVKVRFTALGGHIDHYSWDLPIANQILRHQALNIVNFTIKIDTCSEQGPIGPRTDQGLVICNVCGQPTRTVDGFSETYQICQNVECEMNGK